MNRMSKKEIRSKVTAILTKSLDELNLEQPSKKLTHLISRFSKQISRQVKKDLKKESKWESSGALNEKTIQKS